MKTGTIMVGWTTTESREDAVRLARGLVDEHLAACVQISSPIVSIYRWEGAVETTEEYRLTIKFREDRGPALERWLAANHTYDTPQWIFCRADGGSEKYLKWVADNST